MYSGDTVLLFTVYFVLIGQEPYGIYYNLVQTMQNQTTIKKKEVKTSSQPARS